MWFLIFAGLMLYIVIIYFLERWISTPKERAELDADLKNIHPLFGSKFLGIIFSVSWKTCVGFVLLILGLAIYGILHGLFNELFHML